MQGHGHAITNTDDSSGLSCCNLFVCLFVCLFVFNRLHLIMTSAFKGVNHAALYFKYRQKASPLIINKILEFMKEQVGV